MSFFRIATGTFGAIAGGYTSVKPLYIEWMSAREKTASVAQRALYDFSGITTGSILGLSGAFSCFILGYNLPVLVPAALIAKNFLK